MTLFILFVCIIAFLFLFINLVFAPHNPYQEKYSIFECGFHSFLGQNRTQFGVKFFIFALVYLLLDLEILLTFPFAVSGYINNIYGLIVTLGFIAIITIGFIYELGKSALKIDSRQIITMTKFNSSSRIEFFKLLDTYPKKGVSTTIQLESNIFSFFVFKSIKKHFNVTNLIVGLSTLLLVGLVKWSGIPGYILGNLFDFFKEDLILAEYFFSGIIGLFWKLGIKGIIEDLFKEPLYLGMDSNNPTDDSEGGGNLGTSGDSTSGTPGGTKLNPDETEPENTEGVIEGATDKKHFVDLYTAKAKALHDEIKQLTLEAENVKDDDEAYGAKKDEIDYLIGDLEFLAIQEDIVKRKITGPVEENNPKKRNLESGSPEPEVVSKKRDRS